MRRPPRTWQRPCQVGRRYRRLQLGQRHVIQLIGQVVRPARQGLRRQGGGHDRTRRRLIDGGAGRVAKNIRAPRNALFALACRTSDRPARGAGCGAHFRAATLAKKLHTLRGRRTCLDGAGRLARGSRRLPLARRQMRQPVILGGLPRRFGAAAGFRLVSVLEVGHDHQRLTPGAFHTFAGILIF